MDDVKIGIFGGSGLYNLFDGKEVKMVTETLRFQYGQTSGPMTVGEIAGKNVLFMPRHGQRHNYPSHKVPYKANIMGFKNAGIERVMAPCAVGSLQPEIKPGDFVICDQLIDKTWGRDDSFYHGPEVVHVSFTEPYCLEMRKVAIECCEKLSIPYHPKGTVVVINGPRFATKAESRWFSSFGWSVINMTQYPESVLAREAEMCYLNLSLVTDYDAGLEGNPEIKPVTAVEVGNIFKKNISNVKKLLTTIVKNLPEERGCSCGEAMKNARI